MTTAMAVPYCKGRPEDTLVFPSVQALKLAHQTLWVDAPGLTKARDICAQYAIDVGADVLLMADSDVEFSPEAAADVVSAARASCGVAAVAFVSSKPGFFNVFPLGTFTGPMNSTIETEFYVGTPGARTMPVDGLGCGLMAVHVSVLLSIMEVFPELRLPLSDKRSAAWFRCALFEVPGGSSELPEDLSFCWRAREAGHAVELVQSATIGHRGGEPPTGKVRSRVGCLGLGRERRAA